MIPGPLAKYATDLASLPGDAAIGYRTEGLRGVWDAVACRTVHRVIRASRLHGRHFQADDVRLGANAQGTGKHDRGKNSGERHLDASGRNYRVRCAQKGARSCWLC